eukprot:CAMPEP_0197441540 /NCGR_PEP_ID=MMETSP1175-20131217/7788_1 /TAXON_ID=1003142 /ORGANISM="Triceratium dubium, Strain CCMP147" /LENGTH=97 /DNA_ID=CAMNT_0042971835 /DNA_START=485 /DNA_END=782 /DNA_ORIENTATION=-
MKQNASHKRDDDARGRLVAVTNDTSCEGRLRSGSSCFQLLCLVPPLLARQKTPTWSSTPDQAWSKGDADEDGAPAAGGGDQVRMETIRQRPQQHRWR